MNRADDAELHTDDYVAMSISRTAYWWKSRSQSAFGQRANVTTVHHSHTPVIDFQHWDNSTGVSAMEDNPVLDAKR